jgi:hypothetical protein
MTRHFLLPLALTAVLALGMLAAGCGSSDDESSTSTTSESAATTSTTPTAPPGATARECGNTTVAGTSQLRVTGVGCPVARGIVANWAKSNVCAAANSRPACTIYRGYRCIAARTDAGLAVNCVRPGRSISFIAKRN